MRAVVDPFGMGLQESVVLFLQTRQVILAAKNLFDLCEDFPFQPRPVADLVQGGSVYCNRLIAFVRAMMDIA